MDFSLFDERLIRTFTGVMWFYCIILLTLMLLFVIDLSIYCTTKTPRVSFGIGKTKNMPRKKAKQYLIAHGVSVLLIAGLALYQYGIIHNDIKYQQYIETTAQYTRGVRNVPKDAKKNLGYFEKVEIIEGDKKFSLYLPHRWRDHEFPEGTYWGTIWYSEKTKVILRFDPIGQEKLD